MFLSGKTRGGQFDISAFQDGPSRPWPPRGKPRDANFDKCPPTEQATTEHTGLVVAPLRILSSDLGDSSVNKNEMAPCLILESAMRAGPPSGPGAGAGCLVRCSCSQASSISRRSSVACPRRKAADSRVKPGLSPTLRGVLICQSLAEPPQGGGVVAAGLRPLRSCRSFHLASRFSCISTSAAPFRDKNCQRSKLPNHYLGNYTVLCKIQ